MAIGAAKSKPTESQILSYLPVSPVVLHLMMSLTNGSLHGYGIKKVVERRTQGQMLLGPSTLYGTLARMEKCGLVRRDDPMLATKGSASSQRNYHLTSLGVKLLKAERIRLKQMIAFLEESLD